VRWGAHPIYDLVGHGGSSGGRAHVAHPIVWRLAGAAAFAFLGLFSVDLGRANVPPPELSPELAIHHQTAQLRPPGGFVDFCNRSPSDCWVVASDKAVLDGRMVWSDDLPGEMQRVNAAVNAAIEAVAEDPNGPDIWQADTLQGDCEDFALTKRRRLIEIGWPSSALVIATAFIPAGDYHAVLIARTEHGDFILDNLFDDVPAWDALGYRYVKLQSEHDPMIWHAAATR
jgi:predicted transglutaminase-like cysteine proteinase